MLLATILNVARILQQTIPSDGVQKAYSSTGMGNEMLPLRQKHWPYAIALAITFLCLIGSSNALWSQTDGNWRDSLQARTKLLRDLVVEQNYEEAQLEARELRAFLKRRVIYFPPATLGLISNIYLRNKDRASALQMLADAEQDAHRDKNPETRVTLLNAIVKEHDRWGNEERSTTVRSILQTAQDTLAARNLAKKTRHYEQRIDSLRRSLAEVTAVKENTLTVDKYRALGLAAAAAFVILGLVVAQMSLNNRWKRKWDNREREWELGHPMPDGQHMAPPPPAHTETTTETVSTTTDIARAGVGSVSAYDPGRNYFSMYEKEPQTALIVEPNRQIALYVRSLLSSNFEVTIADSAAEALRMAHETIPDLVVCDAHLNGQEGIDIVRQLKLADRTNHIPVVLLSRHHGNDGRLDALRAGADAWFTRPMLSDEFNTTVKHLIEGQKARHEEFARLLQLYFTEARPTIPNRFLQEFVHNIEMDLANVDLLPDEIARKMQMSNPLFVRKVRALTGKEPGQVIRELRLEKAKFLLEKRAGTPQAISAMVGFPNPGNFSMAFKDYFGENTMLLNG
jgi:DNA-binding response OmpR family regulator